MLCWDRGKGILSYFWIPLIILTKRLSKLCLVPVEEISNLLFFFKCLYPPIFYLFGKYCNTLPPKGQFVNFETDTNIYSTVNLSSFVLIKLGNRGLFKKKKEWKSIYKNYIFKAKIGLLRISEILFLMALNFSIFHFPCMDRAPFEVFGSFL